MLKKKRCKQCGWDLSFLSRQNFCSELCVSTWDKNKREQEKSKKKDNFEEVENTILDKTAEIWNMFSLLEQTHPSDINDLAEAIHDIQKIISIRISRRTRPDKFVTIK